MFNFRKEKDYKKEIKRLKEKINELVKMVGDPKYVVGNIMKRDIKWYNYLELRPAERKKYASNAKLILKNETFKNEIKHIYSDLVQEISTQSRDFGEVRDLRMTVSGVNLIKERLGKIGVDKKPTKENLFDNI